MVTLYPTPTTREEAEKLCLLSGTEDTRYRNRNAREKARATWLSLRNPQGFYTFKAYDSIEDVEEEVSVCIRDNGSAFFAHPEDFEPVTYVPPVPDGESLLHWTGNNGQDIRIYFHDIARYFTIVVDGQITEAYEMREPSGKARREHPEIVAILGHIGLTQERKEVIKQATKRDSPYGSLFFRAM